MGYTPRDVDRMTIWEFNACKKGWNIANGVKPKGRDISDERLREMGIEGF